MERERRKQAVDQQIEELLMHFPHSKTDQRRKTATTGRAGVLSARRNFPTMPTKCQGMKQTQLLSTMEEAVVNSQPVVSPVENPKRLRRKIRLLNTGLPKIRPSIKSRR